jgi:hypothetical protein
MRKTIALLLLFVSYGLAYSQEYNQIDDSGQITQRGGNTNKNFNKHNNDTTKNKEIPRGIRVWTIDRKFGDITPAIVDTLPHLFQNTIFNTGIYGDYNTTGNNYTARESRIYIDRPLTEQFIFTQPYSHVTKQPNNFHFTNTLSPLTNITYDNCGDKTNGEDHINAKFAVNAGKRLGLGFDIDYSYARGYYNAQSTSHFGTILYASYLGDRYNMHTMFSTYHRKVSENGGITDDNYITHPETFDDSYTENEIPTILEQNWNRNNSLHLFLTHKYSLGFYRKEKMTEAEIKARQFAEQSRKDNETAEKLKGQTSDTKYNSGKDNEIPAGRPDNAIIAGDEPAKEPLPTDTTRIKVSNKEQADSLLAIQAKQDSIDSTMKDVFVPVTSFIHTLDFNNYDRIYQAYRSPNNYYSNTYYNNLYDKGYGGDSIYDQTKFMSIKNTFAIALLEGFNKYAKAGLKVFASHELRKVKMPEYITTPDGDRHVMSTWNEHAISIGGQIIKSQGQTLHYKLLGETWLTGEEAGDIKIDFSTDLNFPLFGDTVTLAANAFFYRLAPTFYLRNYHSKHFWWDNNDLDKETRTRIEGLFKYRKTKTSLRVAIEEIQNYKYFGLSYDATTASRNNMSAGVRQCGSNINILTAQLRQDFKFGPLNWENIITYQNSSNTNVLPLPEFNIFTNLYLKFKIVNELSVELGADAYFFTEYYAPDFSPQLNQFAIQENEASKIKLGGYPFIDVYANMHLKRTRFFVMFSHINAGNGNSMYFLAPHYPQNSRVLRMGLSWNFFN